MRIPIRIAFHKNSSLKTPVVWRGDAHHFILIAIDIRLHNFKTCRNRYAKVPLKLERYITGNPALSYSFET